jgi:hypothetical protein
MNPITEPHMNENDNVSMNSVPIIANDEDDKMSVGSNNNILLNSKVEHISNIKTEAINMICRQTDYDHENAKKRLEAVDYDYIQVLNDFFGITPTTVTPTNNKSTNQQIYGEIRNLMDNGARQFRLDQEYADKYTKHMSSKDPTIVNTTIHNDT